MKKRMNHWMLFLCFAALTGALIAVWVWIYLRITNLGITVLWDMVPEYIDFKYYTIVMCLVGGLVVGIFHRAYGPYPESMADSLKRVRQTGTYPYKKLPVTVVAALLSLFFGGAVGPESGLVCLLLGLCCWAMDQFGRARLHMEDLLAEQPSISRGFLLKTMLRGLFAPISHEQKNSGIVWTRFEQISAGVAAGIFGLIVYEVLNAILGRGLAVPHLDAGELGAKDKVGTILLVAIGIGAGYLYLIFKKMTAMFFSRLREKNLHILNAVLGGLILGLVGTMLPMTMFSGGNYIQSMQYEYLQYTPYLLILIGVVKLFLTNVCMESGWRGGHFFPVIFAGLSIGYGFSVILGTQQVFSVVVVTAALLGTMLQQPIGALALSVIFFPINELGWMVLASFVGGCLPLPVPLRTNPENRGFICQIIDRTRQKRIPVK